MCGIAGQFGTPDLQRLGEMIARLDHRGPDDRGVHVIGSAGLACARLSLLDFERGGQPLASDEGRLAIAFNGEVYNHDALRSELRAQYACAFRGRSDTEVVLRGFECEGAAFFARLEGMFALAISDGERLWLARDSFGMKPLFYWLSADGRQLLFASEVKALLACPSIPRVLNRTALAEFATFGYPLGGHTLFTSIVQLGPGRWLEVTRGVDGTLAITHGVVATPAMPPFTGSEDQAVEAATAILRQSVREQLSADHPVGCFLSGGIDSTIVAGLAGDVRPWLTFTAADRLDPPGFQLACRVAAHVAASHELIHLDPEPYIASIPSAVAATELPMGPTIAFLCAPAVRRATKAVLCGDGADELFGGYTVHAEPDRLLAQYQSAFDHLADGNVADEDLSSSAETLQWLHERSGGERQRRLYDFLCGDQLANYHLWLWDRGAMASSVEVRLPFLNTQLRAFAASIPFEWRVRDGLTKVLLRRLLATLLPPELADAVIWQKKRAAWYSGRRSLRAFQERAAAIVTPEIRRSHPFRDFFRFPSELLLLDAFFVLFFVHDGVVPDDFSIDGIYRTYERELADIHRRAR
jgi:asparagine synthase (glutamine-hydrolysing)